MLFCYSRFVYFYFYSLSTTIIDTFLPVLSLSLQSSSAMSTTSNTDLIAVMKSNVSSSPQVTDGLTIVTVYDHDGTTIIRCFELDEVCNIASVTYLYLLKAMIQDGDELPELISATD